MSIPTNRDEFKQHCLRELGKPVIEINIDEDQMDDRVDEALKFYYDYHFDGTEKIYLKHQVDANTIDNQYITIPENIIGVVKIFEVGDPTYNSRDMFSIQYQIALNDLWNITNVSLVPYYMVQERLALISELLVGKIPIRYSRHRDRIYIDMDKNKFVEGQYLVFECYEVLDPDTYIELWKDRWLLKYCAQLFKRQWGSNLIKFEGLQLPGGVQFNGQKIYDDADAMVTKMEEEAILNYSLPVLDMIG